MALKETAGALKLKNEALETQLENTQKYMQEVEELIEKSEHEKQGKITHSEAMKDDESSAAELEEKSEVKALTPSK